MKISKKNIFDIIVTIGITALMIGFSELLGEKEIIFPEITAISVGMILAPSIPWNTNRLRTLICIVICAFLGIGITNFVLIAKWLQIALAFFICQFVFVFSGTSFAPMISAAALPVLLNTKSLIYPISAIVLTLIILLIQLIYEKSHHKLYPAYIPNEMPNRNDYTDIILRTLLGIIVIYCAITFDFRFAIAPPLLVAFTEFTKRTCKARKAPIKAILLVFACALCGTVSRYCFSVYLDLPLTISAVIAVLLMCIVMISFKLYLPPAGALGILPMLIPQNELLYFPFEILAGVSIFMALSLLLFREKQK